MKDLHEGMRGVDRIDGVDPDVEQQKFGDETLPLRGKGCELLQGENRVSQPDDADGYREDADIRERLSRVQNARRAQQQHDAEPQEGWYQDRSAERAVLYCRGAQTREQGEFRPLGARQPGDLCEESG